jgi:adenylosuccinate lyase
MALVSAGADRQAMHEVIRQQSMAAWAELAAGHANPLAERLAEDGHVLRYLSRGQVLALLDAAGYTGDAPARARRLAGAIRRELEAQSAGS